MDKPAYLMDSCVRGVAIGSRFVVPPSSIGLRDVHYRAPIYKGEGLFACVAVVCNMTALLMWYI